VGEREGAPERGHSNDNNKKAEEQAGGGAGGREIYAKDTLHDAVLEVQVLSLRALLVRKYKY
jgi:hypothetical protein